VPGTIETGRWYDIKVELKGPVIRCYLDGKLIHEVTGKGMESMYAVASRVDATGEIVLKVVNAAGSSMETQIDLQSVKVKPTATAAVLTSDSPDDENSFEAPARVAPKCAELHNIGSQFRYTFPANSVTVMRLKTGEGPGSK
jgi:alpha-L-arabinofuranosidase